ncbi:hypothetical protein Hanom_Chr04g00321211 [Helianthus anomalus]
MVMGNMRSLLMLRVQKGFCACGFGDFCACGFGEFCDKGLKDVLWLCCLVVKMMRGWLRCTRTWCQWCRWRRWFRWCRDVGGWVID